MGGGAPRSSCLGGESYSSPGRCKSPARSSCLGLTRRTISTFTLPQNSAWGFIDLTLVSWLAAIQLRRWCPIWPRHNGPILAAANTDWCQFMLPLLPSYGSNLKTVTIPITLPRLEP